MGMKSHVPALLKNTGWKNSEFTARCGMAGISQDTAYRLLRGETNFKSGTIATVARIFGVSKLDEIIELVPEDDLVSVEPG